MTLSQNQQPRWVSIVISLVILAAGIGSIIVVLNHRLESTPQLAPVVTVVAKIELTMETSDHLHRLNDVLYNLPDRRFNQHHRMVRLYAPDGFGHAQLGCIGWFDVDSLTFNALHVDSTYHLSMWSETTGALMKGRSYSVVKLIQPH